MTIGILVYVTSVNDMSVPDVISVSKAAAEGERISNEVKARAVERIMIGARRVKKISRDRVMFCTHRLSKLKEAKVGYNVIFDLHHLFKALFLIESLSEQLRESFFLQMRLK
jgi:hypothetical protein